jgi:hypothetical protein
MHRSPSDSRNTTTAAQEVEQVEPGGYAKASETQRYCNDLVSYVHKVSEFDMWAESMRAYAQVRKLGI